MNITPLSDREITLENDIKGIIKRIRSGKLVFSKDSETTTVEGDNTSKIQSWSASEAIVEGGDGTSMKYRYTEMANGKLLIRTFYINDKEVKFGQIRGFIRKLDNAIKKGCKIGSRSKPKNDTAENEFFAMVDAGTITKVSDTEFTSTEMINNVPKFKLTIEIKPTPQGGKKTYRRLYKEGVLVSERAKLIYVEKAFAKKEKK